MFVKQISVYLENVRGALRELTALLAEKNVNLLALSIADTAGFGIVRIIVASPDLDPAMDTLRGAGYIAKINNVICLRTPHCPGGLSSVLALMEKAGINLEYTYSFVHGSTDDAVLILRPSDKDACAALFEQNGVKMVSQQQVDQLF